MSNCSNSLSAQGNLTIWSRLWDSLIAWLRPRTRPPIDVEDVAGETVLRAVQSLGLHPLRPWPVVWAWAQTTAVNIVASAARSARRLRVTLFPDLDLSLGREAAPSAPRTVWIADSLWSVASPVQRVMLRMLHSGESTRAVSRILGLSRRTVERLRRDLEVKVRRHTGFPPDSVAGQRLY